MSFVETQGYCFKKYTNMVKTVTFRRIMIIKFVHHISLLLFYIICLVVIIFKYIF